MVDFEKVPWLRNPGTKTVARNAFQSLTMHIYDQLKNPHNFKLMKTKFKTKRHRQLLIKPYSKRE